jgi:putative oxidoreductase
MNIKHMLYGDFVGGRGAVGLLILRVVAGLAFVLHGWSKIQHPFTWMGPDASIPGILLALAAVSEFLGGIAWIVGLLTPLASLGILSTMVVATHMHMVILGQPFIGKESSYELPLVYLCVALLLLLAGPGKLSVDALLFGRKDR